MLEGFLAVAKEGNAHTDRQTDRGHTDSNLRATDRAITLPQASGSIVGSEMTTPAQSKRNYTGSYMLLFSYSRKIIKNCQFLLLEIYKSNESIRKNNRRCIIIIINLIFLL